MKFHTDFLAEDYANLCWFQAKWISAVMAILLSIAFTITVFSIFPSVAVIALMAVFYPLIMWIEKLMVLRRANKRFCAFGTSSVLDLTLSKDDITQVCASGETRLPWQDVYAVRESESSYYVFLTKRKAFYFPKRSFENKEHEKQFIDMIFEYAPEKKIKLRNK